MAWLPLTRKQWEEQQRVLPGRLTEKKVVRRNAEWLLEHLYCPDAKAGCSYDSRRSKRLGLDDEPINWGDLGVTECEKMDDKFSITIEEASPDALNLCAYVQGWLEKWGWPCVVQAEW